MNAKSSTVRVIRLAFPVIAIAVLAALMPLAGGAATLKLPPKVTKVQAYTMYAEQLDSQAAIRDLVDGEIKQFTIVRRSVVGSSAALTLDVEYSNGLRRRGVMRMYQAGSTWYFKSISRGTSTEYVGSVNRADIGVVNTILAEQTESAAISAKFVNGTYKRIVLGEPRAGYNSVELPVTFSGNKPTVTEKGRVTCIKKSAGGKQVWFITGFAK